MKGERDWLVILLLLFYDRRLTHEFPEMYSINQMLKGP